MKNGVMENAIEVRMCRRSMGLKQFFEFWRWFGGGGRDGYGGGAVELDAKVVNIVNSV